MEVVKIQNLSCLLDPVKNGHLKRIRSLMLYMLSMGLDCTEVHFASFLSSGFTTMAVIKSPESKMAKRTLC